MIGKERCGWEGMRRLTRQRGKERECVYVCVCVFLDTATCLQCPLVYGTQLLPLLPYLTLLLAVYSFPLPHLPRTCERANSSPDGNGDCQCNAGRFFFVNKCISTAGFAIGLVVAILFVAYIYNYVERDRKKKASDDQWSIPKDDIHFNDPPTVLGSGTFGLVVRAEYRGTVVAVKRAIPPLFTAKQLGDKARDVKGPRLSHSEEQSHGGLRSLASSGVGRQGLLSGMQSDSLGTLSSSDQDFALAALLSEASERRRSAASSSQRKSFFRRKSSKGGKGGKSAAGESQARGQAQQAVIDNDMLNGPKRLRYLAKLRADFVEEMRLLSKLRHPNITTLMGAVMNADSEPLLVMEYLSHGSLHDLLRNQTVTLSDDMVYPMVKDIVCGMVFLHGGRPPVVHGDLKAQNILVDSNFRAKIADFGLSQKQSIGAVGTPYFMAPELLRGESSNTPASDVYAFAILLFEVFSREQPYKGQDHVKVLVGVASKKEPLMRPGLPRKADRVICDIMVECWRVKPSDRPVFAEITKRLEVLDICDVSTTMSSAAEEIAQGQRVLNDVFPPHIAAALKAGHRVQPEEKECVTIFFSDIVGFTKISAQLSPSKVSDMLDRLYRRFDELSYKYDVYKVETIGDAYMAVTNLVKVQNDHAKRIALFSHACVAAANETLVDEDRVELGYINIRVGFHSGSVVANVVGTRNPRFCLFGDTVNTASRMESNSVKNMIHVSPSAAALLTEQSRSVRLIPRGEIEVKGKGRMRTFWLDMDNLFVTNPDAFPRGDVVAEVREGSWIKLCA